MESRSRPRVDGAGKRSLARRCAASLLAFGASGAMATEGGGNLYALGFNGPQAGYLPPPGTYAKYDFFKYRGDATINATAPLPKIIPGSSGATINANARVNVDATAHILTGLHVFEQQLWGGNAALGIVVPYASPQLDVNATGVLTGPRGRTFPLAGQASFSTDDVGDMIVAGMLGWHRDKLHYTAGMNVYLPTGRYDPNSVLNTGRNYWAVEPTAALTYLDEGSGRELSAALGLTVNHENTATQYRSGNELHLDLAAIQHFSKNFYAGLTGYVYHQVTGDSGSGAILGDFKGRVHAVGAIVGGTIPLGSSRQLMLNLRYYDESGVRNRLKGSALWLTAVVNF